MRFVAFWGVIFFLLPRLLPAQGVSYNELWIPPLLFGPDYTLTLQESQREFLPGVSTPTYGYNGAYLGPTLVLEKGQNIQMHVVNQLADTTTTHWHGMHVPAVADGGPHSRIFPGQTWSPAFTVRDDATTMWYHPHLHGITEEHVYRGLAGMILIRDSVEAALPLPRDYGVDDLPIIVQDRSFLPNGEFLFTPEEVGPAQMGDVLLVNGVVNALHTVPAQLVRLRLLNASGARSYNFGFADNRVFYQIGSDGGLLDAPAALTRVPLTAGERAEVIVDFSQNEGDTLYLMSYASELLRNEPGGVPMGGPTGNPLDGADYQLLALVVVPPNGTVTQLPATLVQLDPLVESDADTTRSFFLLSSNLSINGQLFDHQVINERVRLGNVEIWTIANPGDMPHPFHVHDVQFYILDRDGMPPGLTERGKKDVVMVYGGEIVRFIAAFTDYADSQIPYMYHCHFLRHEDMGMMGQFVVEDSVVTGITAAQPPIPLIRQLLYNYPNPFNPATTVYFDLKTSGHVRVKIFNLLGEQVALLLDDMQPAGEHRLAWQPDGMASGVYLLRLEHKGAASVHRMLLLR